MVVELLLVAALERECLAKNIYHEARGEQFDAQLLVAEVTLNRVVNPNYPDTVCGVVNQPNQFSWVKKNPPIKEVEVYEQIQETVEAIYKGEVLLLGTDALYFNKATRMPNKETVGRYGAHTFYR
jgi:N-acetylmuramoyl-L-alanine amidase